LPDNSVDAVVTDPPSGIAFMGAEWDKDKGGRDAWIEWLAEIMREVWRVTKPGGHALVWALPRTQHWTATAVEDAGWEVRDVLMHIFGSGFPKSLNLPGGRGTALKPAHEAWILARKPLAGTVAANVLAHGTGALNIDGCRVGYQSEKIDFDRVQDGNIYGGKGIYGKAKQHETTPLYKPAGRWPPHLLLTHAAACGETCADGCPVAEMDAQSGIRSDSAHRRNGKDGAVTSWGLNRKIDNVRGYSETGGASRFFPVFRYVAKPSTAEKSAGLGHRTPATGGEATGRKDGSAGLDNPRAGAGRNGGALNIHPTVKPRGLMEWLVKLITPPGGVVLDPFTGSGSTGVAAVGLGFDFVGFEMSEEFAGIARDRIGHAVAGVEIETVGIEDYEPKPEATGQGRLF